MALFFSRTETDGERQQGAGYCTFAKPTMNDSNLRTPVIHCVPSSLRRLRTAEIRTRSERESEMLRVVLNVGDQNDRR